MTERPKEETGQASGLMPGPKSGPKSGLISRIDHVSIAVRDYEAAHRFFSTLLGAVAGTRAEDPEMKYVWQLYSLGDLSRLELMHPTGDGSFLDGFLKNREGGVHHITLETPDIEKASRYLEEQNIPYFGFGAIGDVWKELFIHPKDAFGVLIQIAEFEPDDWLDDSVKMPEGSRFSVSGDDGEVTLQMAHPGGGTVRLRLTPDEARQLAGDIEKAIDSGA